MPIPEQQLETWSKQGSVTQSAQTYSSIKSALQDGWNLYSGKNYSVFLQGSYGNDTNIYADSDVDIVMRLDSVFYQDLSSLSEDQVTSYREAYSDADYGIDEFKRDVLAQLSAKYGSAVKPGKKVFDIKGEGNRRDADVLVCAKCPSKNMLSLMSRL